MSTYFGVDSFFRADTKLQPNLTLYEWVVRNQSMPKFWGRTLDGKEALTCEEISFLHEKGTKIAMIYNGAEKDSMSTEENGIDDAKNIHYMLQSIAPSLPENKAVFLLIAEDYNPSADYLIAFASILNENGHIAGFYAITDSNLHNFNHAFAQAFLKAPEIMQRCLIWAREPVMLDFEPKADKREAHTPPPNEWKPFSPSCLSRSDIAFWQYDRHKDPVYNTEDGLIDYNINLARNSDLILDYCW